MELTISLLTSAAVIAWLMPDISIRPRKLDKSDKLSLALGAICVLLSLYLSNIYAVVLSVILAYLFNKSNKKIERLNVSAALDSQIETALQIVSSLHEATGNIIDVLDKTAECVEAPLSSELKRTVSDYYRGMPLEDALKGLSERVPSRDLQIFVNGVIEAEKFGTNPGDVITTVTKTINDRMALNDDLKNEMRGQKTTIYALLALLPMMVGLSMALFPQAKEILTQSFTGKMIICGVLLVEYVVWMISARGGYRWQF